MRKLVTALGAALFALGPASAQSGGAAARPNIVVMLIDDAAFMDLGAYGGEARTPNIDALAGRGALFTRYYSSPLCSPSRAMLLTGMDNHLTGVSTIPEVLPKEHEGQPGYTMRLEPGVATLAERLKPLGYRTLMTGKWHLGSGRGDLPKAHGFDRSFALDASGADNWEDKSYMPFYADAPWFEDDVPAELPDNFYSSEFIVDQMVAYLGEGETQAPFFAYLAFMAVHIPVQAPPEFTANYAGVYDAGWDALRAARWARARERGYVPAGAAPAPMPENFRPWASLTGGEQKLYAARMQANAGMLEAMDHHIGRLIAHLKSTGQYDNTVFVVTSDNGPEPTRGDTDPRLKFWMDLNGYHMDLDGMGEKGSWAFIGPEWAMAAASPHDKFKFLGSEGGIRVPFILAGAGLGEGRRIDARAFVADVAPTLLALAGGAPDLEGAEPMTGRSLMPLLRGETDTVYGPGDAIVIEVSGNGAVIKGDYKLTRNQLPYGDARWRLYDLSKDPGETTDLSASFPGIYDDLSAEYAAYGQRVGVLEVPGGYNSIDEVTRHSIARQAQRYRPWLIGGGLALIAVIAGGFLLWRRRRQGA